jgi:hypothetical protein
MAGKSKWGLTLVDVPILKHNFHIDNYRNSEKYQENHRNNEKSSDFIVTSITLLA